jgi:DNA-binding NtrC family response regulator
MNGAVKGNAVQFEQRAPAAGEARLPIELAGESPAIVRVRELLHLAGASGASVLLVSEPGSDVESVARELHRRVADMRAPFVHLTCAVPRTQDLERRLFGAASGDARSDLETISSDSVIAAARGGVLFLADLTELPSSAQARLARILRDREARIDGVPTRIAFRFVGAAIPGIDEDVHTRRFRSDLYRRIASTRIDLPPLRERADDLASMSARVLEEFCAARRRAPQAFSAEALSVIGALAWPGNLAELRDAVARMAAEADTAAVIQIEHVLPVLQLDRSGGAVPMAKLREARQRFERQYIAAVLQHHRWRMGDAAHTLGIQRPNLYRKARQLGIPLAHVSS